MKYPYVKCRNCKRRVLFAIEMPETARLEYASKKGTKFQVRCRNCGLEEVYRASEVHFLEIADEQKKEEVNH